MNEPEKEYWRRLILELAAQFSNEFLANKIGVSPRQVFNYKRGDIPKGQHAVAIYTFHVQQFGTTVPVVSTAVHSQQ